MTSGDASKAHSHALMMFSGEAFDPDSVSDMIPLPPSHARKRGDPMARPHPGRPTPLARRGGISYSTYRSVASTDINDHLRYLLNAVSPLSVELRTLVNENSLRWSIVLFIDDPPSDWRSLLDKSIAETLDSLGIELILDDPSTITVVEEI